MSKIIGRPLYAPAPAGGGKPSAPKFTYDGDYVIRDDGVVELLTSGTIVFLEPKVIDVFMVGGGGGGASTERQSLTDKHAAGGGGGGGYTRTLRRLSVPANTQIPVTVGAGGQSGQAGGSSAFNATYTVNGGGSKGSYSGAGAFPGADGGTGGGGGVLSNSDYGTGGSDGNNGESGYPTSVLGGKGQGFTTREFGEATGKLYAGGGGGGRYMSAQSPVVSAGGSGGGGTGAWNRWSPANSQAATAGVANTGGGGGGGAASQATSIQDSNLGGSGGSGIVCFREAHELPELAGTWVLNKRLYAPENQVSYTGSYTLNGSANKTQMVVNSSYLIDYIGAQAYQDYNFSTNTWRTTSFDRTLIFPAGATASDEFRTWLASNATKQTA